METFIGRGRELHQLQQLQIKKSSSFVAVYGRRRVGKTFLIRNAYSRFSFYATGMANVKLHTQLANFNIALRKYFPAFTNPPADNWLEAFNQLSQLLEKDKAAKKIIFLDELPWMDTARSGFLPALEHFWNSWAAARNDIILVVCGSATTWIIDKLLNNHGGLHNRVTERIPLYPFTLKECAEYFKSRAAIFDHYQLVQLYMIMGGIPFYLSQVDPGESASQNIDRLCFSQTGILRTEFDNLYRSLFQHADYHIHIIETLSKKGKGLTREEIIEATGLSNGGRLTRVLKELEESHFIRRYRYFGHKGKNSIYQVIDFYSIFYLRWLQDNQSVVAGYWLSQLNSPSMNAWEGIAFEKVCLEHLSQICSALGIAGITTQTSAWAGSFEGEGAQIDLLIDRADRVINICEIKFSNDNYSISKRYADELKRKLRVFAGATQTKKALQPILVTTYGIARNNYSDTYINKQVTMEDLFS